MNCCRLPTSKIPLQSANAQCAPILPFLYFTPTILQPRRRHASRRTGAYANATEAANGNVQHPRTAALDKRKAPSPNALRLTVGGHSFADPAVRYRQQTSVKDNVGNNHVQSEANIFSTIHRDNLTLAQQSKHGMGRRTMTMTQAEHEVFERLQALSSTTKPQPTEDRPAVDEFDDLTAENVSLEELFNDIVKLPENRILSQAAEPSGKLAEDEDKHSKGAAIHEKNQRQLLESVAWPQPPPVQPSQSPSSASDIDDHAVRTSDSANIKYVMDIQNLSRTVETDTELWRILEQRVLSMIGELNSKLEAQQTTAMKAERNQKKKNKQGSNDRLVANQPPAILNAASRSKTSLVQKAIDSYGPAVLYITRLFRCAFPSSHYPQLILPAIKALGPISYVLAASTSLYNEMLYLRWQHYRDLNGCASLVEEMISRDILADRYTVSVYQAAKKTRDLELGPERGSFSDLRQSDDAHVAAPDIASIPDLNHSQKDAQNSQFGIRVKSFPAGYWRLQGIEAAWLRWSKAYNRLVTLTRREMQRRRDEEARISAAAITTAAQTSMNAADREDRDVKDRFDGEPEVEIIVDEHSATSMMADAAP